MIGFSKNIIRSFKDLPDKISLVIHSIGCNFKCYQCFNYETLVRNPSDVCDEQYILDQIKLNGYLVDAIIISGGEFLLNNLDDIILFLARVENIFDGFIIINTNGTSPDKIQELSEYNYVHGFHTDMKLPYHLLNLQEDAELIVETIGKKILMNDINSILKSIEYTIKYDQGYSQIRSVKYPFQHLSAFEENQKYIDLLNKKYNKQTKYFVNEFIEGEK